MEKIKDVLIEGILPNGDGGNTVNDDMTPEEIVENINKMLKDYEEVAYVFEDSKPYKVYKAYKEVSLAEIEELLVDL